METNKITFDQLPEAVALLTKEVSELKNLLLNRSEQPNQSTDETELLTPKETAEFLRISLPTLWRWQKKGKIKCFGIAGSRYYKRSELLESLTELK